ncbi:MAG TPA: YbaK/EbsC family protein [Gaiellaceae bacterium]|nr:YbaK/EbsC family protein [Gaiellaceae bacterium]
MKPWPESVERVASYLRVAAVDARLEEFPDGTPTAGDAARAIGCTRAEIVKSLVFVCDELPVLALVPGDKRADAQRLAVAAGARYARVARPDEVVSATGFAPGAVAPFPAPHVSRVLMDRSFLRHELVWIGAGSDRHMAGIAPPDLARLAKAEIGDLTEA